MSQEVTLADVGEHNAIAAITACAPSRRNGDDAAVLAAPAPNSRTVVSTDTLVQGRHFRLDWSQPEEIGAKAIVQNFADVEAMGARPVAAVAAIAAPRSTPLRWVTGVAHGMGAAVEEFSAELVGGDLAEANEIVITVTAVGVLGGALPPLTLSGARPGQHVVASGVIGHAAAGLALLDRFGRDGVPTHLLPLVEQHCRPHVTPGHGVTARATGATAMTDNSDGLVADMSVIAQRSGVRVDLFADALAPSPLLIDAAALLDVDPWQWVLSGGEDHTLLATTHAQPPSGFRTIGRVFKQRGRLDVSIDGDTPAWSEGWRTFSG